MTILSNVFGSHWVNFCPTFRRGRLHLAMMQVQMVIIHFSKSHWSAFEHRSHMISISAPSDEWL